MEAMKIVVLTGGISTERDVSLSSGSMIYQALCEKGHNVVLVDVFLGYEGEGAEDIFRLRRDWCADTAGILNTHPDLDEIRALPKAADRYLTYIGLILPVRKSISNPPSS